ncbi:ProQ/FINO family protein [Variovorax sp. J22G21]|uniref:ProQ/FINO family protein n=1 Tax=Variovorax fucosicus TaxID=3053517 RepID=UPI002579161A|nr:MULTISPECIES: ProQ/FINO family protein [unclassified Variovorax]MDM0042405.1 ProQ/FINO family protein [Variovorax sp. J22R193]MDM0054517.1 ProQ/FINO family protein [Variovorax sp. J22G47]MDM0061010.1 ProQ/FINO family protein [Variovorax sp. J22G21]
MTTDTAPAPAASRAPQKRKPRPDGPPPQAQAQGAKRARKPHPTLELLFGLYPDLFGARFLPLQRGVFQALLEKHPEVFQRDELKVALGLHTRSTKYLERVAAGDKRHGLDGQPVEDVAPEHVHHAILEVFKRRQARTADDLRPQVRKQLLAAFERSGLAREDYLALVRGQDAATNELVDEAFAELAAQVAKREALQRAFAASGKSVAEFADMYGLDPREVGRTLSV